MTEQDILIQGSNKMFHSPREFAKVGRQYEKKGPQKNVDRTYPLEDTAGEKMIEPSST